MKTKQGSIIIRNQSEAEQYRNVEKVGGYLYISYEAKLTAPNLESVDGDLFIFSAAKLPNLKNIGGYLFIYPDAKFTAPNLVSVSRNLTIYPGAKLTVPNLKNVGGYLFICHDAKFTAPNLESVSGDLFISPKAKLTAKKLYTNGFNNFRVIDDIGCAVMSEKKVNDIEILNCRRSRISKNKIVGEKFFIAKKGTVNAHGKTIKEAIEELNFKMGNRDFSSYKNMSLDVEKSIEDWITAYRMVTGACRYGVDEFLREQGKLKKAYTLREVLEATEGKWGHRKFKRIVRDK